MRTISVLGGLLAIALVGSYLSWTSDDELSDQDAIPLYTADTQDLTRLAWKGEQSTVEVQRREDELGSYLWITTREEIALREPEPEPEEGDEGASGEKLGEEEPAPEEVEEAPGEEGEAEPPAEEPPVRTETRTTAFLGNEAAERLWESFAPLLAMRRLDPAGDPQAESLFGLDEPSATLEVVRGSGPLEVVIGGETYGSRDRYARYDGQVYLIDDSTLRPLQHGRTRLVERRLHPLPEDEIDRITVVSQGQSLGFVQRNKDDRAKAFWALQTAPEEPATVQASWLGKLFRLRVQSYAQAEEIEAELLPSFEFTVSSGQESHRVQVLHDAASDSYYARSPFNRSLTELTRSIAADVVADLDSVMDSER